MKIAVSAYSYESYVREGKLTQLSCVAKAAEMGFSAIEFTDMKGEGLDEQKRLAEAIRKEAERYGIEVIAYAIRGELFKGSPEKDAAEVKRLCDQLDVCKILGAPLMRHDVCYTLTKTGAGRSFDMMLPTLAANTRAVAEYGASIGIATCTENHGRIAKSSDRLERLFNAVAHDNYGLLLDFGNFVGAAEDPAQAVTRLAPYAVHAHAKDLKISMEPNEEHPHLSPSGVYTARVAVGDGVVPVKRCLRILKSAGYDGYVSIEYEGSEDCITAIARAHEVLKGYLAEL